MRQDCTAAGIAGTALGSALLLLLSALAIAHVGGKVPLLRPPLKLHRRCHEQSYTTGKWVAALKPDGQTTKCGLQTDYPLSGTHAKHFTVVMDMKEQPLRGAKLPWSKWCWQPSECDLLPFAQAAACAALEGLNSEIAVLFVGDSMTHEMCARTTACCVCGWAVCGWARADRRGGILTEARAWYFAGTRLSSCCTEASASPLDSAIRLCKQSVVGRSRYCLFATTTFPRPTL